jgi:inorganic pyrophosphatase
MVRLSLVAASAVGAMTTRLDRLDPYDDDGVLRMVVESPRGASVKLKYDAALRAFTVARQLPLGLAYPFDWGFVPGTLGADGDPLDALALHDASTYPGVVLPCRPLAVVVVEQDAKDKRGREMNDRFIAVPCWQEHLGTLEHHRDIPARLKLEIEQFFLSATFFTGKNARIRGWQGVEKATALIERGRRSLREQ